MKVAIIHGPHDVRVEEQDVLPLEPEDVSVRVRAGGICGSDLHYYQHGGFGQVRLREPMILGHEVAGVVEAIGTAVTRVQVGDHVTVNPSQPCTTCAYCLRGLPNQCLDMRFYGSAMRMPHVQGAFREVLVCRESQAVCVPAELALTSAAFAEPLAVCLHAARQAGPLLGQRVLVSGVGPIGALAVLTARQAGASEIVATDLLPEPLALVRRIGADRVLNVREDPAALRSYAANKGYFDVVFEASGSAAALSAALEVVRAGGTVVQIGLGGEPTIPLNLLVSKEVTLRGSFRFHDEFAWAARFIASGAIDVTALLTEVVPLADSRRAFELAGDRTRAMKVQLAF
jgi:L-idonate 5-dehydrogenase